MADYSTMAISPVIGSLVAKDKGDFSNRTKCAGEQSLNCLKYNTANAALIAGGAVGLKTVLSSASKTTAVAKFFDKAANLISKFAPKVASKLSSMPAKAKVVALIATPIAAAVTYLASKALYKSGQIDQKYTDKAKIEAATNRTMVI